LSSLLFSAVTRSLTRSVKLLVTRALPQVFGTDTF
jgi:hypothetical protein